MPLYYLLAALILFIYFFVGFIIAQIKKDNSIADVLWGGGFIVLALSLLFIRNANPDLNIYPVHLWVVLFTIAWGLRLFFFLFKRNKKTGEDPRYVAMREKWQGKEKLNAFFKVFMIQGLFQYIIASSIIILFSHPIDDPDTIQYVGIFIGGMIWLSGFVIETVADQQLRNFKHRPEMKGRVLKTGLWRFSRHPNYFGESLRWWGIALVVLFNASAPYNVLAFISPVVITWLLVFVSGIPLLEEKMMTRPEFRKYASYTSKFILWPPNKKKKRKSQ